MVNSRLVLGYVDVRQGNCSAPQALLSTPAVTSSLLTMTTSGSAFSPVRASLRWAVHSEGDTKQVPVWFLLRLSYSLERHYRKVNSSLTLCGIHQAKLGSGRLMGPKGVSVDQNGHVIVVDNKACTVFIFQLTGKLITKFGSRGNGDKQFAGTVR